MIGSAAGRSNEECEVNPTRNDIVRISKMVNSARWAMLGSGSKSNAIFCGGWNRNMIEGDPDVKIR